MNMVKQVGSTFEKQTDRPPIADESKPHAKRFEPYQMSPPCFSKTFHPIVINFSKQTARVPIKLNPF